MRLSNACHLAALVVLGCSILPGRCLADDSKDAPAGPRIEFRPATQSTAARVDVLGLGDRALRQFARLDAESRKAVLAVYVDGKLASPPPIVGKLSVANGVLRFTPRYRLEPGLSYRAEFDPNALAGEPSGSGDRVSATFRLAQSTARPSTVVERIYPTADTLPDNQLKFYIHFSAPMSRGEAYRHVHLLDANGKQVEAVFLELGEELWDGSGRRFTLYFDPGRVKRGLKPREELGPVLHAGRTYSLVVDGAWRDARRQPLAAGARKTFSVGPPDEGPIDPAAWKLAAPAAGSQESLVVDFPEPLDHAQLHRVLRVVDENGRPIAGSIRTSRAESRWAFTPEQPWPRGKYKLVADTTLEDLAGNSIGRAFEVDQFGPVQKRIETETVSIPFTIEP